MEETHTGVESAVEPAKSSGREKLFLVLVTVGFLFGTIAGYLFYALPKFIISKYLLKKQNTKSKIIRDTTISGFLIGVLGAYGTYLENRPLLPVTSENVQVVNSDVPTENKITKNSADEEIIDNLYRNTKYNFRIKFPTDWKIEDGDGEHVLKKAYNPKGDSINIAVNDLNTTNIKSIEDMISLEDWKNGIIKNATTSNGWNLLDFKVLNYEKSYINNRTAYTIRYTSTFKTMKSNRVMWINSYCFLQANRFFTITVSTTRGDDEDIKEIFNQSISTFVIEPAY